MTRGLPVLLVSLAALPAGAGARAQAASTLQPAVVAPATGIATFDAAWAAIRDTYVDARSDTDWDALRAEFRPRAAAATSPEAVRAVIRELLARIGRSHFDLLPASLSARLGAAAVHPDRVGAIGVDLTPIAGRLVVARVSPSGPAAQAGMRPGSVIESIDQELVSSWAGQPADGSAEFRLWALGQALLRGPTGSTVQVGIRTASDERRTLSIARVREPGQPVTLGHLPTFFARLEQSWLHEGGARPVALIRFNVWMVPIAPDIDRAVDAARGAPGVIIDLRGNPGGVLSMLMGVSGHFLETPIALGTLRTRESELKLVANPRTVSPDGRRVRPYAGPLAILVDRTSYSASEIFAAGMQAVGRARVFGEQTPGGALPAMLRELPNGDVLEYAIGDFVTAAGTRIEGRGVVPDEIVVPTRAALAEGRDPVVEAALRWIRSSQKTGEE